MDDALLEGFVGIVLWHSDGITAEVGDDFCGETGGAASEAGKILERGDFFSGSENAGTMGMEVENMGVLDFGRVVLAKERIGDAGSGEAVRVTDGEVETLEDREAAARVGETTHSDVGDAVDDTGITLFGFRKDAAGENADFHATIGADFDFLGPFDGGEGLNVCRREKDAIV